MPPEPQRRSAVPKRSSPRHPELPLQDDALKAWSKPRRPVEDLDALVKRYPRRSVSVSSERKQLSFYDTPERPKAFSMDSSEFLLIVAQYFREALQLRLLLLLIACQRAGGEVHLTQEEMADILVVHRGKVSQSLRELMGHGIVFKVQRGVYQLNPPYSYRAGEIIPGTEMSDQEYVRVDQDKTIARIRSDESLPELVRFPSLEHLREAITEMREKKAEKRAERRRQRQEGTDAQ